MISTANITMQFDAKPLFDNISVKFQKSNRYGLIGANGCGKSTFVKILAGDIKPTSGTVTVTHGERIGKLTQDQFAYDNFSVVDTVIMGHDKLWRIKKEKDEIYALDKISEADGIRVAELEATFAELDGYSAEANANELLSGLDIALTMRNSLMSKVAPGLKLRVLLAQALFSDPDILLLDEPTNNLDINTIYWLENILNSKKATMVIISHDRHFLNSVCTHMADLDYGKLTIFNGNYDYFMVASTAAMEKMQADNAKKQTQIKELKHFVSRFSANASKSKQATSRAKLIDKIKLDDIKPSSRISPYIIFNQRKKLYRNAVELNAVSKNFAKLQVLNDITFNIKSGDRVAIIGANGIGKTTLIKILIAKILPDSGKVNWSENISIGYYPQDHNEDFNAKLNILEWMSKWKQKEDDPQIIRSTLGRLLFTKDKATKQINTLSGGERGRMLFGKIMLQSPNIIIMDEPTNHLDMESIEALNLALDNFAGTIIFVSHDREFVSSIANKIIVLKEGYTEYFIGNYEDYLKTTSKKNGYN